MLINVPEDVIHSNMKHLLMNRSSDITDGNIDLRTLFIWLWKNPNMRELIFTNISDRWIPHTNIELFAQKITQREMPCNPYLYIGRPTCGVSEIKIIHNNLQYITLELGGDRYQRRRWIHCFEKVHCFVVVASLTDFTDPYWFDESLAYYAMLCDNKWTCGKRIVLVLSKVDILVNKLRNGSIAYNRQLNTVVRKELAHVENDCQQRIIINSIISEYFQIYNSKTSRKWAFEYHIANLVSPVDSKQLKRRIFNDVQPETPYISDSLSPNFIHLHLTKHCNGSLPRFCDIVMVTKLVKTITNK
ncbi:hypothetical protein C9374_002998 [Naegleria lovaniensis]|uniref:Uncharacterized protein n=1 Tax=Naegleria lovaniensis TaxID=51637 RepID=A0AA88GU79_NAELO|nr:uncharacterized protein C9374_002998 [Naegleria lovaniensis]KAG2385849.1 hypothetical protein C9374_002998 [Naegleria lovaniensis]